MKPDSAAVSAPETKTTTVTAEVLCAAVDAYNGWPSGFAAKAHSLTGEDWLLDTSVKRMRNAIAAALLVASHSDVGGNNG